MEQLHAAEGPESLGRISKTVCEQSTLTAHESDAELLETGVESLSLLNEDPDWKLFQVASAKQC